MEKDHNVDNEVHFDNMEITESKVIPNDEPHTEVKDIHTKDTIQSNVSKSNENNQNQNKELVEPKVEDGYITYHSYEEQVGVSSIENIDTSQVKLLSKSVNEVIELIKKDEKDVNLNHSIYTEETDKEAIIIGAGPVGLYTAIQLRQRGFNGSIYIYEKYRSYQRKNILHLPSKKDICSRNKKIEDFFDKEKATSTELEEFLHYLAISLPSIKILYYEVDEFESLLKIHRNPFIIHADGAHSKTRQMLLNTQTIVKPLFNVIQFSYKVTQNPGNKNSISTVSGFHHYKIEKYLSELTHHIEQSINEKENKVTIRFFVDSYYYDAAKFYTFKKPCDFATLESDTELVRTKLMENITFYMKFRSYYNNEKPIKSTFSMLTFKLDCYRSTQFAIKNNNVHHFLVGDCAMGVPFFRSLRNGFFASNNLCSMIMNLKETATQKGFLNMFESSILRKQLSSKPGFNDRAVVDYNLFMEEFSEEEFLRARKITLAVGVKDMFIKVSTIVPWQVNKIDEKKKGLIDAISFD